MIKVKAITTNTYYVRPGFYIDVVKDQNEFGVWLYNTDYGIKSFLFGAAVPETSENDILKMVNKTISRDIEQYAADYMN